VALISIPQLGHQYIISLQSPKQKEIREIILDNN